MGIVSRFMGLTSRSIPSREAKRTVLQPWAHLPCEESTGLLGDLDYPPGASFAIPHLVKHRLGDDGERMLFDLSQFSRV
jgi:hypothetical protein